MVIKIKDEEIEITKLKFRCPNERCENNKNKENIPFKELVRDVCMDHLDFLCKKCGSVVICGMGYITDYDDEDYYDN